MQDSLMLGTDQKFNQTHENGSRGMLQMSTEKTPLLITQKWIQF